MPLMHAADRRYSALRTLSVNLAKARTYSFARRNIFREYVKCSNEP